MDPLDADAAFAQVLARWGDEDAHRAFLDAFGDLDGLAEAGRRYRDVLAERPDDPVALRWRDEVVKRAAALALAQLPRTRPPRPAPGRARAVLLALAVVLAVAAAAFVFLRLSQAGALR